MSSSEAALIDVVLAARRPLAEDVGLFELSPTAGALPPAQAGAHVDVHLPNGLVRQYSLITARPGSYQLGIKREAAGGGGSRWLHDEASIGKRFAISAPRNHFPLEAGAGHSILIAGGIGITPIRAMVDELEARGASWELHYGSRSRGHCAFHEDLAALGARVRFYFDDVHGPGAIPFASVVARARAEPQTHLYCCGPQGMLDAFQRAEPPAGRSHVEHFSAAPVADEAASSSFVVELARSKKTLTVPPGRSILECLRDVGVQVPYSCTQGVCGSCETRVLEGAPLHRDVVLDEGERASNRTMMVCCSRALSARLTLDL